MKCSGKYICKSIIFNVLIAVTLIFYVKPEVEKFLLRATYISTKIEEVDGYHLPTIMICSGYKASILEKYGLINASNLFLDKTKAMETHSQLQVLSDLYQELTYQLMKDLNVTLSGDLLTLGTNTVKNSTENLYLSQVPTFNHGNCIVLTMDQKLLIDQEFSLDIHASNELKQIDILILDGQDWKGIIKSQKLDDYFMIQAEIGQNLRTVHLKLKETVMRKLHLPLPNFGDCLIELFDEKDNQKNPCQVKCIPILIKGLSSESSLPLCQKQDDHFCNLDHFMAISNKYCLKIPKEESKKYTGIQMFKDTQVNFTGRRIAMSFTSKSKTVEIERLVYDFGTLVASIGGSLGLFTGFSFYALFVDILDCLWT